MVKKKKGISRRKPKVLPWTHPKKMSMMFSVTLKCYPQLSMMAGRVPDGCLANWRAPRITLLPWSITLKTPRYPAPVSPEYFPKGVTLNSSTARQCYSLPWSLVADLGGRHYPEFSKSTRPAGRRPLVLCYPEPTKRQKDSADLRRHFVLYVCYPPPPLGKNIKIIISSKLYKPANPCSSAHSTLYS